MKAPQNILEWLSWLSSLWVAGVPKTWPCDQTDTAGILPSEALSSSVWSSGFSLNEHTCIYLQKGMLLLFLLGALFSGI